MQGAFLKIVAWSNRSEQEGRRDPMKRFVNLVATALVCICASSLSLAAAEVASCGSAGSFLGTLVQGSNYRIDQNVKCDGFLRIFLFETDYGQYQINGQELAKTFIQELNAVDALDKMSQSDVFSKSFQNAAAAPLRYGVDLVTNPVGTIGNSLSGVANMFNQVGASLADPQTNRVTTADSLLGVDAARRELATRLHVDPYSEFPPLTKKLSDIAGAMAGGGLTIRAALAVIPGGVGMAISSASSMDSVGETLRSKTVPQVMQEVKGILQRLKVPGDQVSRLTENRAYTPADLLIMARALAKLNAANTKDFIEKAAGARSRDVAFFQRLRTELLARRSAELGGIAAFTSVGGIPLNRTADGSIVAAFPFDELAWTDIVERAATAVTNQLENQSNGHKPVLAIGGSISPLASREFHRLGWRVVQLP